MAETALAGSVHDSPARKGCAHTFLSSDCLDAKNSPAEGYLYSGRHPVRKLAHPYRKRMAEAGDTLFSKNQIALDIHFV